MSAFVVAIVRGFTLGASDLGLHVLLGENFDLMLVDLRSVNPRSSTAGAAMGVALLAAWLVRGKRRRAAYKVLDRALLHMSAVRRSKPTVRLPSRERASTASGAW